MSKQTYIPILLKLFRQFGYEGVTLTKISQATGLGKASLYHHFPGGKAEMAKVALAEVNQWLETKMLPILDSEQNRSPIVIFQSMGQETSRFFNSGKNPCLWAVLIMEETSDTLFHDEISDHRDSRCVDCIPWIAELCTVSASPTTITAADLPGYLDDRPTTDPVIRDRNIGQCKSIIGTIDISWIDQYYYFSDHLLLCCMEK
jgi:AcrR family transcriptional regulator